MSHSGTSRCKYRLLHALIFTMAQISCWRGSLVRLLLSGLRSPSGVPYYSSIDLIAPHGKTSFFSSSPSVFPLLPLSFFFFVLLVGNERDCVWGGGHGLKLQIKVGGEGVKEGNDRIERRRKERVV